MSDLIDRQAAIDVAKQHWYKPDIAKALEELSSAQPEIIRCKDCEYWDTSWQNDYAPNYHYCPLTDTTHRDDFYCADAERRTDE